MKAMIWTAYGSPEVLHMQEVEKPVPKDKEILIQIHTATVTAGDCELRGFYLARWARLPIRFITGFFKPRIPVLGMEVAGVIEAVGASVTEFKPGDRVFGTAGFRTGAYAEYTVVPEKASIVKIPEGLSFEEAVTLPTGGINGWHFARVAKIRPGEKVLINGAGGSIGTYALQFAMEANAQVSCVDRGDKLEMLRSLGAVDGIDYTKTDFSSTGKSYDVIIDVVGKGSYTRKLKCLNPGGRLVLGNPSMRDMLRSIFTNRKGSRKAIVALADANREGLKMLLDKLQRGEIKAVLDRSYPLDQLVEAHRYVEAGHKKGSLIIRVRED